MLSEKYNIENIETKDEKRWALTIHSMVKHNYTPFQILDKIKLDTYRQLSIDFDILQLRLWLIIEVSRISNWKRHWTCWTTQRLNEHAFNCSEHSTCIQLLWVQQQHSWSYNLDLLQLSGRGLEEVMRCPYGIG